MTSALGHFCVFSAPAVSNSIFFLREVCLFTKRPERNPYPGWPATKLQWNAERWKRDWSCHSPHPSYKHRHILIICHSNRCAREIRGEKGINRSEHRQSWSGMGRFNGFISVCVYARCSLCTLICILILNVCVKVMSRNLLAPWWLVY